MFGNIYFLSSHFSVCLMYFCVNILPFVRIDCHFILLFVHSIRIPALNSFLCGYSVSEMSWVLNFPNFLVTICFCSVLTANHIHTHIHAYCILVPNQYSYGQQDIAFAANFHFHFNSLDHRANRMSVESQYAQHISYVLRFITIISTFSLCVRWSTFWIL